MTEAKMERPKIYTDPGQQIERIQIEGRDYILMREPVYHRMLLEIESLDSALDLQRAQADASLAAMKKLLAGNYTQEQILEVFNAPTGAQRIELLRRFRNMSQQELAKKANVSQPAVSNLENGKVQLRQVELARNILSALDVPESLGFAILKGDEDEKERS